MTTPSKPAKKTPAEKKKTAKKVAYQYAVGRRKRASARVRLYSGKGKTIVNNKPIEEYFPGEVTAVFYQRPFEVTETIGKYYATVRVVGSGLQSQLEAVVHGLARALDKTDRDNFHLALKQNGLLTRDSRQRERRKAGQAGRARHKKQSPKR